MRNIETYLKNKNITLNPVQRLYLHTLTPFLSMLEASTQNGIGKTFFLTTIIDYLREATNDPDFDRYLKGIGNDTKN